MIQKYTIMVKPGSKKGPLVQVGASGELVVYVRQRAVDGQANRAVVELLARHFGVGKSQVKIVAGGKGRAKIVAVG